jgi:uncharacterized protein DUF7033
MLRITHAPTYLPEREYVLRVVFNEWLGLDYVASAGHVRSVHITNTADPSGARLELDDTFFSMPEHEWLTPASLPKSVASWNPSPTVPDSVPQAVLYGREAGRGTYHSIDARGQTLGVDVLGTAFFMLSRYEEAVVSRRDEFDRFAARFSMLHAAGLLERPIVNEQIELLWSVLRGLWPSLVRRTRSYRCLLSCDVDNVEILGSNARTAFRILGGRSVRDALREGSWLSVIPRATRFWRAWRGHPGADALDDFDFLMDVAERSDCRFAFNFIARREDRSRKDGIYGVHRYGIRRLMRRIHERHHELGFHGSYESFRDPAQIRKEFSSLKRIADEDGLHQPQWGGRQHYLRWEAPTTWEAYADAGLTYDSTLTYADHAGFRCGVCYEFPVFNLRTRRALALRERPLIVMEASLFGQSYMQLSTEEALAKVTALSETCRRFDGDFTFLWHNGQSQIPSRRVLLADCTGTAAVHRPSPAFAPS